MVHMGGHDFKVHGITTRQRWPDEDGAPAEYGPHLPPLVSLDRDGENISVKPSDQGDTVHHAATEAHQYSDKKLLQSEHGLEGASLRYILKRLEKRFKGDVEIQRTVDRLAFVRSNNCNGQIIIVDVNLFFACFDFCYDFFFYHLVLRFSNY